MEASTNQAGFSFRFKRDSLNAQEFPSKGMNLRIKIDRMSPSFGGEINYSRLQADYGQYIPASDRSTVRIQAAAGFSRDSIPFYDLFYIGGYSASEMASHQFLGLKRDELAVRQMLIMGAEFRHQIFSHPLSFLRRGFLTGSYNGMYFSSSPESPYQFRFLNGGGIGLALDTMLGPVRAIVGWSEGGRFNYYVSLGPSF
jgi:outer membrane protein assembly factor BamA